MGCTDFGSAGSGRCGRRRMGFVAQKSGNLHEVLEGEVYRSAQPSAAQLVEWTTAYGFRSVLNLRGPSDADWYQVEQKTAARLNLTHADFAMRDSEILTLDRAAALMALMEALPKPVLIHCKAGADRTGLAYRPCFWQVQVRARHWPRRRSRSATAMSRCPSSRGLAHGTKAGSSWSPHPASTADPSSAGGSLSVSNERQL